MRKPMNQGARIIYTRICERKKEANMGNIEGSHSFSRFVSADKNTVMARRAFAPRLRCSDMFTTHTSHTTQITGSTERRRCRVVYRNSLLKIGENVLAISRE